MKRSPSPPKTTKPVSARVRVEPAPRKRLAGPARRETLLDAAAEIIRRQGADAVTMERVADQAEINKAVVYRFFANRDDLLIALSDRENQELDDRLAMMLTDCTTFDDKIRAIVLAYMSARENGETSVAHTLSRTPSGPAVKAHQEQRVVDILRFFVDLVDVHYAMTPARALSLSAVFTSGLAGIIELSNHTRRSQAKLADDFVTMVAGAAGALGTPRDGATG